MFEVHEVADKYVMKPVVDVYIAVVPKLVRTGVSNFFNNIDDLFSGVNALLQGKPDKAGDDFGRVMLNTFVMGGIFDVASDLGIERGGEDFGQTFGVWGLPAGAVPVRAARRADDRPRRHRPDRAHLRRPGRVHSRRAGAQLALRRRRRRHPRAGSRRDVHRRHGRARQIRVHPQCVSAAAALPASTTASSRPKKRTNDANDRGTRCGPPRRSSRSALLHGGDGAGAGSLRTRW